MNGACTFPKYIRIRSWRRPPCPWRPIPAVIICFPVRTCVGRSSSLYLSLPPSRIQSTRSLFDPCCPSHQAPRLSDPLRCDVVIFPAPEERFHRRFHGKIVGNKRVNRPTSPFRTPPSPFQYLLSRPAKYCTAFFDSLSRAGPITSLDLVNPKI